MQGKLKLGLLKLDKRIIRYNKRKIALLITKPGKVLLIGIIFNVEWLLEWEQTASCDHNISYRSVIRVRLLILNSMHNIHPFSYLKQKRVFALKRERLWTDTNRSWKAKDTLGGWNFKRLRVCISLSKSRQKGITGFLTWGSAH